MVLSARWQWASALSLTTVQYLVLELFGQHLGKHVSFSSQLPCSSQLCHLGFCNVGLAVDEPTLRFCNAGCAVCVFLVSPDFTKAICLFWGFLPCSFFCSFSTQSANSLPCVSAVEQDDRTCSRGPGLSHRLHLGSVVSHHRYRFAGNGRRS